MTSPAIARVALYARVSTSNTHQDPEMQLRDLREHAQRHGWTVHAEYVDRGISGAKENRPQLNRMMADAQAGKFDAILVWKLDRFGRSLKHLLNTLSALEKMGISFVSLRDNLDLTTATGRLMFSIIGAMAEFERSLIRERIAGGLRNARAKGKRLGRLPAVEANPAELLRLRREGLSLRQIEQQTGVTKSTAARVLKMITAAD